MKRPFLKTAELLDCLAGRLEPERSEEIRARLAENEDDCARLDALREIWDRLGQWNIDPPAVDLTTGVMDRLRNRRTIPPAIHWPSVVRVAASWLLAIGLGTAVGKTALHYRAASEAPSEREVADVLSLDALGTEASTGLTAAFLAFDDDADETKAGG
jgi:anti-sigma factor RsiW